MPRPSHFRSAGCIASPARTLRSRSVSLTELLDNEFAALDVLHHQHEMEGSRHETNWNGNKHFFAEEVLFEGRPGAIIPDTLGDLH